MAHGMFIAALAKRVCQQRQSKKLSINGMVVMHLADAAHDAGRLLIAFARCPKCGKRARLESGYIDIEEVWWVEPCDCYIRHFNYTTAEDAIEAYEKAVMHDSRCSTRCREAERTASPTA